MVDVTESGGMWLLVEKCAWRWPYFLNVCGRVGVCQIVRLWAVGDVFLEVFGRCCDEVEGQRMEAPLSGSASAVWRAKIGRGGGGVRAL